MPMLIRGGRLLTMTAQGEITADILISGGRIRQIAATIEPNDEMEVIEARGLTLLPGMTDLCIRSGGYAAQWLFDLAANAGVTSGIVLPEDGSACELLADGRIRKAQVRLIRSVPELDNALREDHDVDDRLIIPVRSHEECTQVLSALRGTHKRVILAGLHGCEGLKEQITVSGASVVIGVDRRGESPWRFAAALANAGVPVALSTFHPSAKMRLLPVCASLCVRDGMPRERALSAITSTPADLIGLRDRGRLAPGCQADIVLFDGDPLLLATSRVATIVGGRLHRSGAQEG